MKFSKLIHELLPASSIEINQTVYDLKRQGRDIITLSLGEAFFDLPHKPFTYEDFEIGFHYSDTAGLPILRNKISNYYKKSYQSTISSDQIVVSCGSKPLTWFTMAALVNPGDNIILHEPAWLSYSDQAKFSRAEVRYIPYDQDINFIKEISDAKTKLVILNNPNNPRGFCYSKDQLQFAYDFCAANNIFLMVDEAYSDFAEVNDFVSLASIDPALEHGIVVNSLSKNFGMSGFRIGYSISSRKFASSIIKINQHLVTCAPTILQSYIANNFDTFLECTLPQIKNLTEKRKQIQGYMNDLGISFLSGNATFYFMVSIGSYEGSASKFCENALTEHNIALVPGTAYGPNLDRYVRLGIGSEPVERIQQALFVLKGLTDG